MTATRPYASPLRDERAAQTRSAVLEAARRLFTEHGWQVGVRDIAKDAGVSVETVYATYGSKLGLLLTAGDVAVVDDERAVPLADRPEFRALAEGSLAARIRAATTLVAETQRRTAGLQRALEEAARVDGSAAEQRRTQLARIAATQRAGLALVLDREPTPDELDDLAVLGAAATYTLLTRHRGKSHEAYVEWLHRNLDGLVRSARRRTLR